ncbi:MAG: phenylalanine--tRNA ligase subunit alpha [Pirellulales bacterium]
MPDEILLNEAAYAVWQAVKDRGPIELGEVAKLTGIDQAKVSATATEAAHLGFFHIKERPCEEIVISPGARDLLMNGLPERHAAMQLHKCNGVMTLPAFVNWAKSVGIAMNEAIKWGTNRGWIERAKADSGPIVLLTTSGRNMLAGLEDDDDETILLNWFVSRDRQEPVDSPIYLEELHKQNIDAERVKRLLSNRPELAKIKKRVTRVASLSDNGQNAYCARVRVIKERNTLTPEDLESGAWREIKLRPYDVKLAARDVYPAKIHPLRKIIEQTRRAFLEMGFAEVVSPMIESAFWNFDALFQPQDHPAREMQDTFYMRHPATTPLPDARIVDRVRRTHEDGWETGSEGWGYKWSPERSQQVVLRTHTTAATIRALAANPNPPGKFFCVGWTYRNETISFKHLPVFHQVDGIIIDEEANLASLMGTLQEFYSKMGFGRVKFKPAFYPYTEPSVDVVVYMESRGKWLEMGGAGIFRPEVTLPLGCTYPVLAWGLGIERLAMLRFGLSDIRELYGTNLSELEKVPLCQ